MIRAAFTPPVDWLTSKVVDGYAPTFDVLASRRIPGLFKQLKAQLQRPLPLELFARKDFGPAKLLKDEKFCLHFAGLEKDLKEARDYTDKRQENKSQKNDFAGVYVFLTEGPRSVPFYVGITQTIFRRVRTGHLRSRKHNAATLLFQMVRSLQQGKLKPRKELDLKSPKAELVSAWFCEQRVAILPLASPVERYAFELYASMELQTGRWNSFETH
jgi:hypothetical protein